MKYRVTFTIGQGFDRNGQVIPGVEAKRKIVLRATAQVFGGFSAHEVAGGWINNAGDLVIENSLVIVVFTDKDYGECEKHAEHLAQWFNQESVMLVVEDVISLDFVRQGPVE